VPRRRPRLPDLVSDLKSSRPPAFEPQIGSVRTILPGFRTDQDFSSPRFRTPEKPDLAARPRPRGFEQRARPNRDDRTRALITFSRPPRTQRRSVGLAVRLWEETAVLAAACGGLCLCLAARAHVACRTVPPGRHRQGLHPVSVARSSPIASDDHELSRAGVRPGSPAALTPCRSLNGLRGTTLSLVAPAERRVVAGVVGDRVLHPPLATVSGQLAVDPWIARITDADLGRARLHAKRRSPLLRVGEFGHARCQWLGDRTPAGSPRTLLRRKLSSGSLIVRSQAVHQLTQTQPDVGRRRDASRRRLLRPAIASAQIEFVNGDARAARSKLVGPSATVGGTRSTVDAEVAPRRSCRARSSRWRVAVGRPRRGRCIRARSMCLGAASGEFAQRFAFGSVGHHARRPR
jgi:hypothetical protein